MLEPLVGPAKVVSESISSFILFVNFIRVNLTTFHESNFFLSVTTLDNLELQSLVNEAYGLDGAFFDTAERYGSHLKTALGLGWGETETLLQKFVKRAEAACTADDHIADKPSKAIIATKFTPSPWRTTPQSVVEACEQSMQRLGVEQVDL